MCLYHGDGSGYGRPPIRAGSRERVGEAIASRAWGRWYWRAEGDKPCEDCVDMDGQSFDSEDEVPERVHPNCMCEVEYVIEAQHREKHQSRYGKRPSKRKRPGLWQGRRR